MDHARFALLALLAAGVSAQEPRVYMADGIKIGEVDQSSALVWQDLANSPSAHF